jgi:tetratricopeptide (TPR) repeat protein
MVRKFRVLALVLLFCGGFAAAQVGSSIRQTERPWWYTMEQGKFLFREGDYGSALLAFEDARRQRQTMYTRMEQDLIDFLSISEVRRMGDSLAFLETYIAARGQVDAAAALAELYYRVPRTSLNDSAKKALEELGKLKNYPEAEYWIGETYRVEGELGLALTQFLKVHKQRSLLESPGFDTRLLYEIAEIHRIRQEYTEMERALLEILTGSNPGHQWEKEGETAAADTLWSNRAGAFAQTSMLNILGQDGITRFLTLYRYNNTIVEKAHRRLGFYYYAAGRHNQAAEHLMFAFLIQNTILLEEVLRSEYDYTFTNLDAVMEKVRGKGELEAYIEEVEYYRINYYLGTSLYATGKIASARGFWEFLNNQEPAGEWQGRARAQLRSPFVERAIETP